MKSLLVLAALFTSLNASADFYTRSCEFQDYQAINAALENNEIRSGAQFKDELAEVLMQEMGPKCDVITEKFPVGIPGSRYNNYRIVAGNRMFEISIVKSLEENTTYVVIK